MNYGRALRIVRASKNLSQQELAEMLNLSKSLISRIEAGERNMTNNLINLVCVKLKLPKNLFTLLATDLKTKISVEEKIRLGNMLLNIVNTAHENV